MTFWLIDYPLFIALILLTIIDIHSLVIPNIIVLPAFAYFFIIRTVVRPFSFMEYISGLLVALGFSLILGSVLPETLLGFELIGAGDIKLLALLGFVLGLHAALPMLLIFSVVFVLVLIVGKLVDLDQLPALPMIDIAVIVAVRYSRMRRK